MRLSYTCASKLSRICSLLGSNLKYNRGYFKTIASIEAKFQPLYQSNFKGGSGMHSVYARAQRQGYDGTKI